MEAGGIPIARVLERCVLLGAVLLLVAAPLAAPAALAGDLAPAPMNVAVRIDTSPSGIPVEIDGVSQVTPYTLGCVENTTHVANATNVSGGGTTRYRFTGWTDAWPDLSHPFLCDAEKNFTAVYRAEYFVVFNTFPAGLRLVVGGVTRTAPFGAWCQDGTSLDVVAISPQATGGARRVFGNWSDGGAMGHAVPCTGPGNFTASFRVQYLLTVSALWPGLFVQVDNVYYPFRYSDWCDEGTTHWIAVETEQQAPDGDYRFVRWSDLGAASHPVTCSRSMNVTAEFVLVTTSPPPIPTSPMNWAVVMLAVVLVLILVFVFVAALLVARSSRRRAAATMPVPPPGALPAHVVWTPSAPPPACPRCGRSPQGDWTYCPTCGAALR